MPPPQGVETVSNEEETTSKTTSSDTVYLVTKDFADAQQRDEFCQKAREKCLEILVTQNSLVGKENRKRLPVFENLTKLSRHEDSEQNREDYGDSEDDEYFFERPDYPYVILPSDLIGSPDGKLLVPQELRTQVLERFHSHKLSGHLGIRKTLSRIKRRFVWPKMTKDVTNYVQKCLICAQRKAHGGSRAPLQPVPPPSRLWQTIAMDIIGPITTSLNGNNYILVIVEYLTRYVFAVAMKDQTAETVAKAFINTIILEHGVPEVLITDQGSNFRSHLFESLANQLGIKQVQTTAYHPQSDGSAESHNKTLIDIIACYVQKDTNKWDEYIKFATFAYNTSEHASLEETPFYLLFGRDVREPSDPLEPIRYKLATDENTIFAQKWKEAQDLAREKLQEAQEQQKKYYDRNTKESSYEVGEHILLKQRPNLPGKFNLRWTGPYIVTAKTKNPLNYKIQHVHDKTEIVTHVNRMKRLRTDELPTPEPQKESETTPASSQNKPKQQDQPPTTEKPTIKKNTPTQAKPPHNYGLRRAEHVKLPKRFQE